MTKKHKIIIGVGLVVVFSFLLLIFFGENTLLELNRLKKDRNVLIKTNEELVRQNDLMYNEIDRLKHDPKYIENVARQELGMIGKNEIIFKIDNTKNLSIPEKIK
ncbi:MAG: septum formation initiator family protein [Desulfobacterales bacterium]